MDLRVETKHCWNMFAKTNYVYFVLTDVCDVIPLHDDVCTVFTCEQKHL